MKHIPFFFAFIAATFLITGFMSCDKPCDNEQPRVRIINNGTDVASVQVKTAGGNTVNLNNVDKGTTSDYSSFTAGSTVFTVKIKTTDYVETVNMSTCMEYDIIIGSNNDVSAAARTRE